MVDEPYQAVNARHSVIQSAQLCSARTLMIDAEFYLLTHTEPSAAAAAAATVLAASAAAAGVIVCA